jgi:2-dehydropantoate 2-reductase
MRFAIVGAGGVGAYFGALFARAGHDVGYVARGAQLEALRSAPLEVECVTVGNFSVKVRAAARAEELGPADVVLFAVKTYDTEAALEHVKPLLGPDTIVLGLQNGLDGTERLIEHCGRERVIGAVVYINCAVERPGLVAHRAGPNRFVFGELAGGKSARVQALHDAIATSGAQVELHENVTAGIWTKFTVICGYSGALALGRCVLGVLLESREGRELIEGTIDEAARCGRAKGIPLPDDLTARHMKFLSGFEYHAYSSMERDLAAGRRLEVDALNGAIVRLGRELGIATPYNTATFAALQPFANGPRT